MTFFVNSAKRSLDESRARTVRRRVSLALVLTAASIGGYCWFWHAHLKRFYIVRPGVLYRTAQPTEFGMRWLVSQYGVKTVLSLQLYDVRLYHGFLDPGRPSGQRESIYVAAQGAVPAQWAMGEEQSWPWFSPWHFEQFFKLFDNPDNWPVAVHCQGGRHRTGTVSALFRLEYDRWPVERALEEMYSFKFGPPVRLQERNLRTYLPRARPSETEWGQLRRSWQARLGPQPLADYDDLVRRLRSRRGEPALERALLKYVRRDRPFALPLAQRLIDRFDDPLAVTASGRAAACLDETYADRANWSSAAAVIADFGALDQQQKLLARLGDGAIQRASPERFDALAAGAMNRYTPNRIAYLQPLLENESCHLTDGAREYRYCDTAVTRLSTMINQDLTRVSQAAGREAWNFARQAAREWFAEHPCERRLTRLLPPTGESVVHAGDPIPRRDLSKLETNTTRN
jgi:hypothetical protein